MDKITKKFRDYHDKCSRRIDDDGNYIPHQSVYEFSPKYIQNFTRAYAILNIMDKLNFQSFVEIGCAEGCFPNIIRKRFAVPVFGSDFSKEAVSRMRDIFDIDGFSADGTTLPLKNKCVDLVLCTEVLEHMTNPEKAAKELIRIAGKYLIVTVPAANSKKEQNEFVPDYNLIRDGHLHLFTEHDLRNIFGPCIIIGCDSLKMKYINAAYRRIGNIFPSGFAGIIFYLDRVLSKKTKNVRHFIVIKNFDQDGRNKEYDFIMHNNTSLTKLLTKDIYKYARKIKLKSKKRYEFMGYTIAGKD